MRYERRPCRQTSAVAMRVARAAAALLIAGTATAAGAGQTSPRYMRPAEPIARAIEAAPPPIVFASPSLRDAALLTRSAMPSIAELAEPELGLAGVRINPRTNGPSRFASYGGITFRSLSDGARHDVALPPGARVIAPLWSPDGRYLAFLVVRDDGIDLWAAEAATGEARRLTGHVNATFPGSFAWLPDGSGLLVRLVLADRGGPPPMPRVPEGPVIRETTGRATPVQTLPDLLGDPHDDALFAYYFTSQLALIRLDRAAPVPIGEPGIVHRMSISPDGRYILQTRLERPFSHAVAAPAFPSSIIVTELTGKRVHELASLDARNERRGGTGAVAAGPRSVEWRADADATLVWAEAGTGDDAVSDRLYMLAAPFTSPPVLLLATPHRYVKTLWGRSDVALIAVRADGGGRYVAVDPSHPGAGRLLPDMAPRRGYPIVRDRAGGGEMLRFAADGRRVLVRGTEHSKPYVAAWNPQTGATERLWTSQSPDHVRLEAVLGARARRLMLWSENRNDPPNLFLVDRAADTRVRLTDVEDPAPQFAGIQHRILTYERADGVRLSGTLYLPAGYDAARDGPLPMLMWAYPTDYASAASLSGVATERNVFVRPHDLDPPLLLIARGYAIFTPAMPIFGVDGAAPNDHYVEQLIADAQAAVDAVTAAGVADRRRIAIGGHSYGAAMAANLLARTDLFRTGIAMSGAYNRTLTPFGYQTERRDFWEAPDAYLDASAFIHADRINEPILLIHGADDPKSGTTPMQSERLYDALQTLGGTARYVLFPYEGHSFTARESVMHVFWEISHWLDRVFGRSAVKAVRTGDQSSFSLNTSVPVDAYTRIIGSAPQHMQR